MVLCFQELAVLSIWHGWRWMKGVGVVVIWTWIKAYCSTSRCFILFLQPSDSSRLVPSSFQKCALCVRCESWPFRRRSLHSQTLSHSHFDIVMIIKSISFIWWKRHPGKPF
jgi:hypothetical protein